MCKIELEQDRHNLELWAIYARLEHKKGKLGPARRVYSTALSSPVAQNTVDESLELWADWATMEWEHDEQDRTREVLLRRVDGDATGEHPI